jgi:hypothetical protein
MTEEFDEKDDVQKKRLSVPDRKKLRNLIQYRGLTDEEYNEKFDQKLLGIVPIKEFEERIQKKINEFGKDYDLTDLNSNDMLTLRTLAQAYVDLEDYTIMEYNLRRDGINDTSMPLLDKLSSIKEKLRNGISNTSNDLKITRKVRKADKEQSVMSYIEDLKKKAKEFYESKMQLIFCPKCNTWIASIWVLYPEDSHNKITVVCNREHEDGSKCGEKITLSTVELLRLGGSNKSDVPESIR